MVIGIVTTWFERGAAYVSRIYKELLQKEGHTVFIFARGGENIPDAMGEQWDGKEVTRSNRYIDTTIDIRLFKKWIKNYHIEALLFNEQQDFRILAWLKKNHPQIKLAAYVDYYTEYTIPWFGIYDLLICNTHRHMQAMKNHPQKYYIRWGTDTNVFQPRDEKHDVITFFHSAGVAVRKGTDLLVDAYIHGKLYEKAKLVIHTQKPIELCCQYKKEELGKYNIEVIEKTVPAPGLYYLGDVYVYPTRLDGLGLTMYEALSCGLPMITTDFPPMNEVGDETIVRRVKVADFYSRGDAYYYPMAICDETSLIEAMTWYADHPNEVEKQKIMAREYTLKYYKISDRSKTISDAFVKSKLRSIDFALIERINKEYIKAWNPIRWIMKYRWVYSRVHKR